MIMYISRPFSENPNAHGADDEDEPELVGAAAAIHFLGERVLNLALSMFYAGLIYGIIVEERNQSICLSIYLSIYLYIYIYMSNIYIYIYTLYTFIHTLCVFIHR